HKKEMIDRSCKKIQEKPRYNYLQLKYKYITEPLTLELISSHLHFTEKEIELEIRDKSLKIYLDDKLLNIYEDDRHVEISCASLEYAEAYFLPILRQLPLCFFITRHSMKDYGWLSLIKNNKLKNKQLLYSLD